MRSATFIMLFFYGSIAAAADTYADWPAYMKGNGFSCPGPFDTLEKPREVVLAGKTYSHTGYRMEVSNPDADDKVVVGIVSAVKDVSEGTRKNFAEAVAWFKKAGAEWLVVNGDIALNEFDLQAVAEMLGESGLPTLVVLGNSESKGSWARVYRDLAAKYPNLINGVWVRQIVADDIEFWTLGGYHDRAFVHEGAACMYKEKDINVMLETLEPAGKGPLALVSHGPPLGKGKAALDRIVDKKNVGDPLLNRLIDKRKIPIGIFGHILEAGGAAVGRDQKSARRSGRDYGDLHINAGSISGDPWGMNDGSTAFGMAVLLTVQKGKARYEVKRFAMTPMLD